LATLAWNRINFKFYPTSMFNTLNIAMMKSRSTYKETKPVKHVNTVILERKKKPTYCH